MTIVASSALTSARSPRPEPLGARERHRLVRYGVDPNRIVPHTPTRAQWDLLEYAFEEECARHFGKDDHVPTPEEVELYGTPNPEAKHPVVAIIPPSRGAVSDAYAHARVLELNGYLTLSTGAQIGGTSPHQASWLYTWRVQLTDKGVEAVRERIGRRIKAERLRAMAEAVARVDARPTSPQALSPQAPSR